MRRSRKLVEETAEYKEWLARGIERGYDSRKLQVVDAQKLKTDKEYYKQTKKTEDGMNDCDSGRGDREISPKAHTCLTCPRFPTANWSCLESLHRYARTSPRQTTAVKSCLS
jgi:hypothetical protein